MSVQKISILIVDDSEDLASVLATLINDEPDMMCIDRLDCADALLEVISSKKPGIVLLDLTMPGEDPLEIMAKAASRFPDCRFIVLSGYDDQSYVDVALNHGAWGFVSKHCDVPMILRAIRAVVSGEQHVKLAGG